MNMSTFLPLALLMIHFGLAMATKDKAIKYAAIWAMGAYSGWLWMAVLKLAT